MNYINKKKIILISLSSLIMSGCVSKTEQTTPMQNFAQSKSQKSLWASKTTIKKNDCVDCYAAPIGSRKPPKVAQNSFALKSNEVISYDYSKAPIDTYNNTIDYSKPPSANSDFSKSNYVASNNGVINTLHYDAYDYTVTPDDTPIKRSSYTKSYVTPKLSYVNSSQGSYSSDTAIQIGAFRRLAGAKLYAKKYDALSSKYHVAIKTGIKDNQPLHRVRIEGFSNRAEAKKFIARYAIEEAFLVRR